MAAATTETTPTDGLRHRRKGGDTNSSNTATNSLISSSESESANDDDAVKKMQLPKEKSFFQKLFTHKEEEKFIIPHIHKILGLSCLGSFVYRFAHLGRADGNFGPHFGTLFFVLHHWLLNASSFIFKLPKQRIQDGGYRIWPEYRIHALVFASRNLAFILLRAYEQHHGIGVLSKNCLWHMDILIVLATCALADLGSMSQGKYRSSTIRGASFSDPYEQWFASEMQIYLTSFCLVGYRRYTVHLVALCVIQCNSFLMTLRRKNVASHHVLVGCYSIMLLIAFVAISLDDQYTFRTGVAGTFGGLAIILRMGPLHVNKYVLWSGLGLLWWYIRTTRIQSPYNSMFWLKGLVVTRTIAGLLGWYKRSKAPQEEKSALIGYLVFGVHLAIYVYLYVVNFVARWY